VSGTLVSVKGVLGRADGLEGEEKGHTSRRGEEEEATTKAIDHEGGTNSPEQVPDGKDTVDEELNCAGGDTDGVKDSVEVVGDETVAGPLREEGNGNDDDHTFPVTGGGNQRLPADIGSNCAIELDSGLHFLELELDEGVLIVAVCVVVSEDLQSLFVTALGYEPTRGLWSKEDEEELEDGGKTLKERGDTPGPVTGDVLTTESGPSGDDVTRVPEGVVEGSQGCTVARIGNLGDQHGGRVGSESNTETDQETCTNEHTPVLGGGLEGDSNQHDY